MTAPLIGPTAAPDLHVMTFNVRRRMPGLTWPPADRWQGRRPRVQALLRTEQPAILGVQEALPDQADAIGQALGDRYRFVGHGRRPGRRGEGCPLFYDAERFELLSWHQQALSDTPDEAGSASWGNVIPRVLVQATLRDRAESTDLLAVNVHLDVFSGRARLRAAEEIRRLVAGQPLPAIVTGDLNAGPGSPPVRALLSGGLLTDAWTAAEATRTPEWGTYGGYRRPRAGHRIDWIAVSRGVAVRSAGINDRPVNGGWPSDHLPVQAVVRLPRTEARA